MRIEFVALDNYIGIFNGTGKRHIEFDFTQCKNVIAIRGFNGSGKSTLMRTLNPFPDSNEMLIPGLEAHKRIIYLKNEFRYIIDIIYPLKNNGERATSKVSILKLNWSTGEQWAINPNGNVSEAKELIMNEFELDNNYITLSQLSSEDRGLADKRPAERKKFVNDILSDLTAYNSMYKILTKKSSTLKALTSSINMKIDRILNGRSLNNLKDELAMIEKKLKSEELEREEILQEIGALDFLIVNKKKDLEEYDNNINKKTALDKVIKTISSDIVTTRGSYFYSTQGNRIVDDLGDPYENPNLTDSINAIKRNNITEKISYQAKFKNDFNESEKLGNINSEIKDKIDKIRMQLSILTDNNAQDPEEFIKSFKENLDSRNQILDEINKRNASKLFESNITIEKLDMMKAQLAYIMNRININLPIYDTPDGYSVKIDKVSSKIRNSEIARDEIVKKLLQMNGISEELINSKVPKGCKIKDCPMRLAIEKAEKDNHQIQELKKDLDACDNTIKESKQYMEDLNIRYRESLSRSELLTHYNSFSNIILALLEFDIKTKSSFDGITSKVWEYPDLYNRTVSALINKYIDIFNMKAQYEALQTTYINTVDLYTKIINKVDQIKELKENESALVREYKKNNIELVKLESSCKEYNGYIADINTELEILDRLLPLATALKEKHESLAQVTEIINKAKENIDSVKDNMNHRAKLIAESNSFADSIEKLRICYNNTNQDFRMAAEYINELTQYNNTYQKIETVKKYTSPTTGIQTLFMEAYMNNVLIVANQLLQLMFNGQFILQPFVINESEFRIPCAGNGYLNDDISSMSTSQICIISMIISFAMLYNSSSCYNILKLDEIDGGLDTNNRLHFISMLNQVMAIMKCEQCFIISHNAELETGEISTIQMA